MLGIQRISIAPKYTKEDGLIVMDSIRTELPFEAKVLQFVILPPKAIGGNHRHPRKEAFLALGEGLELHWQDEEGELHTELFVRNEVIIVAPFTPHGIVNKSETTASIAEWADGIQHDVEQVDIIANK